MQKTFVLGLGAQKAGTTWLYKHMHNHPQCALGNVKELAALDMYFGREFNNLRWEKRIAAVTSALENAPKQLEKGIADDKRVHTLLESFEYLASCTDLWPSMTTEASCGCSTISTSVRSLERLCRLVISLPQPGPIRLLHTATPWSRRRERWNGMPMPSTS